MKAESDSENNVRSARWATSTSIDDHCTSAHADSEEVYPKLYKWLKQKNLFLQKKIHFIQVESGASPKFTPKKSTRARTTRNEAKPTTIAKKPTQVDSEEVP